MTTSIVVISGGLREPSSTRLLADRLETAVRAELARADVEAESTIVELRPLARAIVDAMLTGFPTTELATAFDRLGSADGVVAVTPAFNASFSGLFKSFFDVVPEATLSGMPILIGATGGTERHSLVLEHAMRPMFSYLQAIVSPTAVYAATEDFGAQQETSPLGQRITRAAGDFARLLRSCGARERPDVWADELTAMEQLLSASGRDQQDTGVADRSDLDD